MLRIASLLPSTTDIVDALGLAKYLVGVTHECDIPQQCLTRDLDSDPNSMHQIQQKPRILTESKININSCSQREIDAKVKQAAQDAASLTSPMYTNVTSLYPLNLDNLAIANPTIVLTQDLCGVCAPSTTEVECAFKQIQSVSAATVTTKSETFGVISEPRILSCEPKNLDEVSDTFVAIADLCRVPERGRALKEKFHSQIETVQNTVETYRSSFSSARPTVLLLEWLDPPFDGGHWIPGMIEKAGCNVLKLQKKERVGTTSINAPSISNASSCKWDANKSKQISWEDIYEMNPDVILVACCGFNLERNYQDALDKQAELQKTRAGRLGRIYAADGNQYFARPSQKLAGGVSIIAQCAHDNDQDKAITNAVALLDFSPQENIAWKKIEFHLHIPRGKPVSVPTWEHQVDPPRKDMENDYILLHDEACQEGRSHYLDPETGYFVFTEVGLKQRGRCCGAGCRHCPYFHENVAEDQKARRIKQPSFLYDPKKEKENDEEPAHCSKELKVLFFSGGKDSFLALRALVKQQQEQRCRGQDPRHPPSLSEIILLTTFDMSSRMIAYQEIPIDTVIQQAKHLSLPLVGVPLDRCTSEKYVDRIRRALNLITSSRSFRVEIFCDNSGNDNESSKACCSPTSISLVFGDLHLEHIRKWREETFSSDFKLEFPLWHVPYSELMADLESSTVSCVISASTSTAPSAATCSDTYGDDDYHHDRDVVVVQGDVFDRELWTKLEYQSKNKDSFGENGEFHTVVEVWKVDKLIALGLK